MTSMLKYLLRHVFYEVNKEFNLCSLIKISDDLTSNIFCSLLKHTHNKNLKLQANSIETVRKMFIDKDMTGTE